jgi:hypothetical protein
MSSLKKIFSICRKNRKIAAHTNLASTVPVEDSEALTKGMLKVSVDRRILASQDP